MDVPMTPNWEFGPPPLTTPPDLIEPAVDEKAIDLLTASFLRELLAPPPLLSKAAAAAAGGEKTPRGEAAWKSLRFGPASSPRGEFKAD